MSTRAHVRTNGWIMGVSVYVARDAGDGQVAVPTADAGGVHWEMVDEAAEPHAFLTLNDDVARAILDALLEHYRGSGASRELRADYDHECKRVDRFIDHLTGRGGTA